MGLRSPAAAALLLAAGAVLGAGLATLLRSGPSAAPPAAPLPDPGERARPPAGTEGVAPPPAASPAVEAPGATLDPATGGGPLDGLGVRAEEWAFLRVALVRERERVEASRIDPALGGLEVLRRVALAGTDPMSVLGGYDAVRARVRVEGTHRRVEAPADGSAVDMAKAAGDAAIVELGPGTFTFDRNGQEWFNVRNGLRSLEIRGAGMDRTTLRGEGNDLLHVWEEAGFENLVFRDLTLEGGSRGSLLLDVRGRASVAMENVRVRGWMEAGHSAPVGISGSAFLGARGCEFLGEGRRVHGISVRGTTLAVFEKCLFADMETVVSPGGGPGAGGNAVRFLDCAFENCTAVNRRMQTGKGKVAFPVQVLGGRAAFGPPELTEEERRRAWGAEFLATLEGTTFGPGRPPCTAGDLLSLLDRLSVTGSETVVHVLLLASTRGEGPTRFGVRVMDRARSRTLWRVVGPDGQDLETGPLDPGGGWSPPRMDALEALSIAAAVRLAGIPAGNGMLALALGVTGSGETAIPSVYMTVPDGWPSWNLDAKTGKVLGGPWRR